jgi:hypothetical protein
MEFHTPTCPLWAPQLNRLFASEARFQTASRACRSMHIQMKCHSLGSLGLTKPVKFFLSLYSVSSDALVFLAASLGSNYFVGKVFGSIS